MLHQLLLEVQKKIELCGEGNWVWLAQSQKPKPDAMELLIVTASKRSLVRERKIHLDQHPANAEGDQQWPQEDAAALEIGDIPRSTSKLTLGIISSSLLS